MAEAEFWRQKDDRGGSLGDQIGGVRLEVEKVRTEVAGTETRLVGKIGGVETRLVEKIGEVETRLVERIGGVETKLSDRMDGLERSLRGWLVIGVSVIGAMIALLGLFG